MPATIIEVQTTASRAQSSATREEDRRKERRYAIPNQNVEIRIPPESQVIEAQVTNVSRNGVGLVSKGCIDAGVQIMFAFGDQYVYARVRHCHPIENGFAIGAAIGDMTCC